MVDGASTPVEQVSKQLDKLVRVLKVVELSDGTAVERELALIKVRADPALRGQLLEVASVFGASVVDMSPTTLVLEAVSSPAKLDALLRHARLLRHLRARPHRPDRAGARRRTITDDGPFLTSVPRPQSPTRPTLPPDDPVPCLKIFQDSIERTFRPWPPCTTTPTLISA